MRRCIINARFFDSTSITAVQSFGDAARAPIVYQLMCLIFYDVHCTAKKLCITHQLISQCYCVMFSSE